MSALEHDHEPTDAELDAAWLAESRARQGLPMSIEDPDAKARIAAVIARSQTR